MIRDPQIDPDDDEARSGVVYHDVVRQSGTHYDEVYGVEAHDDGAHGDEAHGDEARYMARRKNSWLTRKEDVRSSLHLFLEKK